MGQQEPGSAYISVAPKWVSGAAWALKRNP